MILHVIAVAFHRPLPLRILMESFMVQTNPAWRLNIIHDGPSPESIKMLINSPLYKDPRIFYTETDKVYGRWGHPNRKKGISELPFNHHDFVLLTNDDNYYVPTFVQTMLRGCSDNSKIGFVYCNTVHNYQNYDVLLTQLKRDHIDMGSFIVRVDIAKKIGFNSFELNADGIYAEQCSDLCRRLHLRITYVNKALFVHN